MKALQVSNCEEQPNIKRVCNQLIVFYFSMSLVWNNFQKRDGGSKAVCLLCGKAISCQGGSTSGLNRHLATVHQLKPSKSETTNTFEEEELAKMAAVDGFSFHQIATSSFVQKSLLRFYDKTLTSPTAIKDAVLSYHQKKQTELAKEMLA